MVIMSYVCTNVFAPDVPLPIKMREREKPVLLYHDQENIWCRYCDLPVLKIMNQQYYTTVTKVTYSK